MSRTFVAANSEKFVNNSAPVTAAPFTMFIWFNVPNVTTQYSLFWLGDKDSTNNDIKLIPKGDEIGDPLRLRQRSSSTSNLSIETANGYSADVWHSACGIITSNSDRRVILDGDWGNSTQENVTTSTPVGFDRVSIGVSDDSTPTLFIQGLLAHAAIWSAALRQDEVEALGAGVLPLLIRPESLVFYAPLTGASGGSGAEIDIIGGLTMTNTNTVQASNLEPPLISPGAIFIPGFDAAAGGGTPIHYYRRRRAA